MLLAHLGTDYERVPIDIFAGDTLTAEYAAMNPALTTPVLEYEPGRFLPESGAILLHLAAGTDLLPEDPDERAQVHRWLFFEQSTVLPTVAGLRFRRLTGRIDEAGPEAERTTRVAAAVTATVDNHLRDREYIAADALTVADIALYSYLHVADEAGVDTSGMANLSRWVERMRSEPAHVADLEPYPDNARPGQGRSIWDAFYG